MRFNIIIGNPPYQEMTGGGAHTESAKPIYNKFVDLAFMIHPVYMNFLIPSRWLSGGNATLDEMRSKVVASGHVKAIHHWELSTDMFVNAEVGGGVQFLFMSFDETIENTHIVNHMHNRLIRNKNIDRFSESIRPLDQYSYMDNKGTRQMIVIIENDAVSIINKISICKERFEERVFPVSYFGIETNYDGDTEADVTNNDGYVRVVCSNNRKTWVERDIVKDTNNILNKYKVCISTLSMDRGGLNNGKQLYVISKPIIVYPGDISTSSFIIINTCDTLLEAENTVKFFKTKFVRFLIQATISSTHVVRRNLIFVPLEDMQVSWTDDVLYHKYGISKDEQDYIDERIDRME